MSSPASGQFPTTAWGMVRAAKDPQGPEYLAAMNRFVAGYWRPVFYFLRTKGYPLQQAEDLTQEFFLQFLQRDWLKRAEPNRGRFRTFLLTILVRFLSDQGSRRAPKQKVFDQQMVSISALVGESERTFEPPDQKTAEDVFMRHWAQAVIANVRLRLDQWCRDKGRPDWYEIFSLVHFPPQDSKPVTKQQLAQRLRQTRDQIRYGLEQANQQFVALLSAEVAEQVGSYDEMATEIRDLELLLES